MLRPRANVESTSNLIRRTYLFCNRRMDSATFAATCVRSKHALNSIHKSCKLQNFKCDDPGKCHKNTYSPVHQTLFSPLTSMRYKKKIARSGNTFTPRRGRAPFSADQKERGLWGRECLEWRAIESYRWHRITGNPGSMRVPHGKI